MRDDDIEIGTAGFLHASDQSSTTPVTVTRVGHQDSGAVSVVDVRCEAPLKGHESSEGLVLYCSLKKDKFEAFTKDDAGVERRWLLQLGVTSRR